MAVDKVYALTITPQYSKQKASNKFPTATENVPDNKMNSLIKYLNIALYL